MLNKLLNFFWNRNRTRPPEKDMSPGQAETMFAAGDVPPGGSVNPNYDNYENGLPPDWDVRRREVLIRDNFICQAVGCLRSGSNLHAHHRRARFEGGSHRLENLVALCAVHHAIVHLDVSKVEVSLPTCSIVSRHWRRIPNSSQRIEVRINIRRHKLISVPELSEIRNRFGLKCLCGFEKWNGNFRKRFLKRGMIWTWCPNCNGRWEFEQGLLEETASQLAVAFPASRNVGRFIFDLNLITGLKKPISFEGCPKCLNEGRRGYLKGKKGRFGKYIGCSEWPACNYTRPLY